MTIAHATYGTKVFRPADDTEHLGVWAPCRRGEHQRCHGSALWRGHPLCDCPCHAKEK